MRDTAMLTMGRKTPEKPVTPWLWALAFTLEGDGVRAGWVERLYRQGTAAASVALATWLADRSDDAVRDGVTAPTFTKAVWRLVQHIEATAPSGQLRPIVLNLPCAGCGYAFDSSFRGGRYSRLCSLCFPYEPTPPAHPRGGLTMAKRGVYPRRRRGQDAGVTDYWQQVLCGHPDCLVVFSATRPDDSYCPEHRRVHRETVRRIRKQRRPKTERFSFHVAAPQFHPVTYCWGPRAEATTVPAEGQRARDDDELLTLATLAQHGFLVVRDHT